MTYPINVGRNIARESALTHFVLASDIELYPNPGLIESFLKMATNPHFRAGHDGRVVYVVSIFEIEEGLDLPRTKGQLLKLAKEGTLIPFHQKYCPTCHAIPGKELWNKIPGGELYEMS